MKEKLKNQINCLKYHLSEAIEDRDVAIERVEDIKKELNRLESKNE